MGKEGLRSLENASHLPAPSSRSIGMGQLGRRDPEMKGRRL